ncbi:MAG: formylglycine-generating enzyme family protein [Colwellia sp.]
MTFKNWDACVKAGGCSYKPSGQGWGHGNRPVINVSYNDITQQYIPWLNKVTGERFRLPSEAEWEYAARAGSSTKYSWGNSSGRGRANCDGCGSQWDNSKTAPVASFSPNDFGLYDMHGNVWEWTQDCWKDSYNGAPNNGKAWQSGNCTSRVLRGGSWGLNPGSLRSANRYNYTATLRNFRFGFRLVQGR